MSGHNKWSSIKHKKGAADAKRGRLFTRLVKEVIVAARDGGGDPNMNPRLRTAVNNCRNANMPQANIERAIKRGTGEIDGISYDSYIYEGYGHNGVAIMVEALTDNKNRTVAEVRHIFGKYGGSFADNGAVAWVFEQKGLITVLKEDLDEDEFMMAALDCGAEDIETDNPDCFEVYTSVNDFHTVQRALEDAGFRIDQAELTRVPNSTVKADDVAEKLLRLLEKLEECDDVQKVYANFDISDEVMERLEQN
ncbi:MAG: YebC/PmpR family DNA-binding transcriptional regulator [Candidatus Cloacimonetes bacterium]|nr:YebC/PmpR family DNA-binding transcriptional regulator [Candidatus Cloacimonadota bacterium]